jgi:hypothetical protein
LAFRKYARKWRPGKLVKAGDMRSIRFSCAASAWKQLGPT